MRRELSAIRWFALVLILALAISACTEREATLDTGPVVRLRTGGETYSESVYSYCWPQSDENVACDVDLSARAQPAQLIQVAPGEPLEVDLSADDPQPESITVTLLDGPGGQTELAATGETVAYTAPTEPGQYRVQVDVQYADVNGSEAYVSYVFGLDVAGEAVAAAPTEAAEEATEEATAEPTEAVTEEPTEEPTAEPTVEPTVEPTAAPTETPTPLPSPTAAPTLTPVPTEEPTQEATEEATEELSAEATEEATEESDEPEPTQESRSAGIAQVTEEPTEEAIEDETDEPVVTPTARATVRPTATARPTDEPTEELTAAATDEAEPTEEAGEEPTAEVEAADEPTEEPTRETRVTPTLAATDEPEDTVEPEETREETPEATAEDTEELGSVALVGNVRIVEDRLTVPLTDAEVTFTYTPADDPSNTATFETTTDETGRFAFDPIELDEDDTILLTISAPGYATQEIELSGADAYALPVINLILLPLAAPTPEPTAVPTATPVPPEPTSTPPAPEPVTTYPSGAPILTLAYAGRAYEPLGYQLCQPDSEGALTDCIQEPTGTAVQRRLSLMRGAAAQLLIAGDRPVDVRIEYLTDTGIQTGQPEQRLGDNIILFTVTPEPGPYIMSVRVLWDDMQVTYYFRVAITG